MNSILRVVAKCTKNKFISLDTKGKQFNTLVAQQSKRKIRASQTKINLRDYRVRAGYLNAKPRNFESHRLFFGSVVTVTTVGLLGYSFDCSVQTSCEGSLHKTRNDDSNSFGFTNRDKPIKHVVVLMAMEQEAQPFLSKHNFKLIDSPPWDNKLPFVAYEGDVGKMKVTLVWAGQDKRYQVNNVATTASTLSCYVAIQAFEPDLIISAGTAGGFKSTGGEIADVYISSKCVFHSRRIPDSGTGYSEYGFGHYRSPPLEILANRVKCKIGVISTSDSLDFTPKDLQIMRSEGACIKEMEAAAIACKFSSILFYFHTHFCTKIIVRERISNSATP
eukprot:g10465.t1